MIGPTTKVYVFNIPSTVMVAAASTNMWDLFNASGDVVRVYSIKPIVNLETVVTGVGVEWQLLRTTAVGTGGTAITPWQPDTLDLAIDAGVTCRSKPTGGATASTSLLWIYDWSDESQPDQQVQPDLVPEPLRFSGKGIVLRPGQGIRLNQETNSSAGNYAFQIVISLGEQ